jgi:cobalt-zinc-cadmium efflux system outer membrane protein
MLLGVFELLALKQDEFHAYQGYIEAIRDYWLARADLGLATGTQLPSTAQIGGQGLDIDQLTKPPSPGMDHSGHKGHTSDGSAHTMSHEMNHGDSQ